MDKLKIILGGIITAASGFLGGMDGIMRVLIAFIVIDYLTGVIAAVKQKKLSSEIGFWGMVRKCCIVLLVGVANLVDVNVIGSGDVFRTAIALCYIGNEGVSLLENIGILGVRLPKKLMDVLEQLRNENGGNDDENE